MKKKFLFIILSVLCMFLCNVIDVKACLQPTWGSCNSNYIVQRNSGKNYIGNTYFYYTYARQLTATNVYCIRKNATGPTLRTCSVNNSIFGDATRAAIGYIIANYNGDYGKAQYLIHRVLELREGGPSVGDYSLYQSEYETAAAVANNYANKVPGTYYLATLYNCGDGVQPVAEGYSETKIDPKYNITYNGNGGTYNGATTWLDTTRGPVSYGSSYTTWSNDNFFVRNNYDFIGWNESPDGTGTDWTSWINVPWTWTYTRDITLYAQWVPDYKINKVNSSGNKITSSSAKFGIYSDSMCTNRLQEVTTSAGVATAKLTPGTYYLKETQKPEPDYENNPYYKDETCHRIVVGSSNNNISIVNKTECEALFEKDSSVSNRIKLYQKYGNSSNDSYRNLLNFDGVKDAVTACQEHPRNYNPTESCLQTKQVNDTTRNNFNKGNLSDFNETISSSSYSSTSYCLTNFEIIKKQEIKNGISAGQFVINTSKGSPIVTGKVTKTCYIHKGEIEKYGNYKVVGESNPNKIIYEVSPTNNNTSNKVILELKPNTSTSKITASPMLLQVCESPDECEEDSIDWSDFWEEEYDYNKVIINSNGDYINYKDYVDSIEINNILYAPANKVLKFKNLVATRASESDEFYKIEESIEVDYISKPVYGYKISGKLPENQEECFNKTDNKINPKCSLLGYGVISQFKDGQTGNSSFNFKINKGSSNVFKFNANNVCEYMVNPEIIKYEENTNGDLDLEFRSIDKKDPFDRSTNSNWCDGENCDSNNNTVNSIIKGRNDSYNSTGAGGLYTNENSKRIVLTPDTINRIKEYNKENPYNDYTVKEDTDGNKTSNFFEYIGLKKVIN